MNETVPQDRVHHILDLIAERPGLSQREVASSTGLSLGLVNITLKRLVQTGYIKVSNLNKRKVEYILTSEGFVEKAKRTYNYISQTMRTFRDYEDRLDQILNELLSNNTQPVALLGDGELTRLAEMALRTKYPHIRHRLLLSETDIQPNELVLDCRFHGSTQPVGVSVLARLLKQARRKQNAS